MLVDFKLVVLCNCQKKKKRGLESKQRYEVVNFILFNFSYLCFCSAINWISWSTNAGQAKTFNPIFISMRYFIFQIFLLCIRPFINIRYWCMKRFVDWLLILFFYLYLRLNFTCPPVRVFLGTFFYLFCVFPIIFV